jgi:hypothetical protein
MDKPFCPTGPTVVVATAAVNVVANTYGGNSFRVRNTAATVQYLTWGPSSTVASAVPVAGTPALNTVGLQPGSVEIFGNLGPWMIGNAGSGFEVTQGDGV